MDIKQIPLRRDGTQKRFWYDPEYPGHIVCNEGSEDPKAFPLLRMICVGHGHG